ncbi:type II secretion system F family protein [Desulfosporosinus lacus]|uniref:Flp pilus assembly protein TadB n=1 Tax=Desulfosporosinus lacus DSM 15449 TaxID=1121420 RepID=A0A1M5V2W7_9FIRM|nr:hypothetical protein [Desulfosporosinus lacus]SHH69494.1 hypothetical protein SAMN02746098_01173 [Desulfosporosinus lacus DSM 15449]
MTLLILIAFLTMVTGAFLVLDVSPQYFAETLAQPIQARKPTMRKEIRATVQKKKLRGIRLLIKEARDVLEITGRSAKFGVICLLSLALMMLGALLAITMNNLFMVPVMAVGFSLLPFWYILFTATSFKKHLNGELETALSVITTSYLRSESIITAVDENLPYLNPPVVQVLESFLAQSKLINSNLRSALERLKGKLFSKVFDEWLDALIACQEDKTLKTTLIPIVNKLSDMRIVAADLDYLLYAPVKEFITMAVLLVGNIPLIYVLNKSWFHTLVDTTPGKLILAVCVLVIFISTAAVVRLMKPVEYKR